MQYRPVGDTGIEVSVLGHGTMRYHDGDNAQQMIQHGLSLGMTYFDVGPAYKFTDDQSNAEVWVGKALQGVPRESVVISSKAQPRSGEARVDRALGIGTRDQMWQCLENSLRRLQVDYLDFYQLWDMSADDHFEVACRGEGTPLQAMREAKEQGLVRHLGFTTHSTQPGAVMRWLEEVPDFRFITVYYNFNDRGPEKLIDFAREQGVGVCIMGPLRGGLLVGESEAFARALPDLAGLPVQEIALRFLLSNPGITTVISGMNEIAHMDQNARVASLAEPMTADQRARFIEAFREFSQGEPLCTVCRYCAGSCPEGLAVADMLSQYQLAAVFGLESGREKVAAMYGAEGQNPARCVACGACVEKCPQKLPIPEYMERMAALAEELHNRQGG